MSWRPLLREASDAWRCLRGVFCVYKPPRVSMKNVHKLISFNLTKDLNRMRFTVPRKRVEIIGSVAGELTVRKCEDFSTHPLVLGPMFEKNDIELSHVNELEELESGVCIMGVGEEGKQQTEALRAAQLMTTYTVEGKLGVATRDLFYTGAAAERSSFEHVTRGRVERVLSKIQTNNQRRMIDQLGLPPNSQKAYELLSQEGLVRPNQDQEPILYRVKLVELGKPHFTLEVTAVNAYGQYFLTLINDIGLMLKTNAHTLQVRCIRRGPFGLDSALLQKHWFLDEVLNNINDCQPLVAKDEHDHASLAKLADYEKEQRTAYQLKKEQLMLQQKREREIGMKLLEDYRMRKREQEYLSLDDGYGDDYCKW